jgi:[ribosomal protein S5]-alanine N-acetyltransferase
MFGRRRKILARANRVHIFAASRDCADDFIAFTSANEAFHQPWVFPAADAATFRGYLERLEDGRAKGYVVARNADEAIVGVINVNDIILGGFSSASLGYYGSAAHARRGYMTEGLGLVLDQAFDVIGLHRIEANVQPGNANSLALIARLGFRKEGFSPRFLQIDGAWRDHERWALLAEEWRAGRRARSEHVSRVV